MPVKKNDKQEDWRVIAHEIVLRHHPGPGLQGYELLKPGARTSKAKKIKGKTVTDLRRDDIMALFERARKARYDDNQGGLKGLFGGGK